MYVIEEYISAGVPCHKIGHSVKSVGDAMVSRGLSCKLFKYV